MALLNAHQWPGNVRELQNILKQALLSSRGDILTPEDLPRTLSVDTDIENAANGKSESVGHESTLLEFVDAELRAGSENLYEATLRRMERMLLTRVLVHTGGNQVRAAKILGITRGSLRTKIRDLGISLGRTIQSAQETDTL
jgi:two-component system nitrogen regulation response regulator GlnG